MAAKPSEAPVDDNENEFVAIRRQLVQGTSRAPKAGGHVADRELRKAFVQEQRLEFVEDLAEPRGKLVGGRTNARGPERIGEPNRPTRLLRGHRAQRIVRPSEAQ